MIGVFDSGLGGLTILKHFLEKLPEYDYIYLGDSARLPYGERSQAEIYEYTREAVDFLFAHGCNLVVVACNSASARALRKIQQEYLPEKYPGRNVIGVIRPLVEEVVKDKSIKRVGVIGTKATIESNVYRDEFKKLNPEVEMFKQATPLLVPLIEAGEIDKEKTKTILEKYLQPLKEENIQSLILGCTHYPLLFNQIKKELGKDCIIYNPGEIVASSLKDYIDRHPEIKIKKSDNPQIKFYTSGDVEKFKRLGGKFLEKSPEKVEKVELK